MSDTPDTIDITGLNKAEVLAALYNASRPLGLGYLHFDPKPMTAVEAQTLIDEQLAQTYNKSGRIDFDYLKGRVMKVEISGDSLRTRLYDRDNGEGAAERALTPLLKVKAA